jgi:chemotaxis methyl-accepting protein methylase
VQPAITYCPTFAPEIIEARLADLLVPGAIHDAPLERQLDRLAERFRVYAATYPYGLWAPGLAVTQEMRVTTESLLPLAEIRQLFRCFFGKACAFPVPSAASPFRTATTWLDSLQQLQPVVRTANPAGLLRPLLADGDERRRLLFALFLPRQYGGGFGRYPGQLAWLREWLKASRPRLASGIACLDAACGSGEGAYELVELLGEHDFPPARLTVHGSTLEPLELFAAAHGFFPHDATRQAAFRKRVAQLHAVGLAERLLFVQEDLLTIPAGKEQYDLILCNGVLGGPFLNDRERLAKVLAGLARRLKPEGVLLAANRFHEGWQRRVPGETLRELLRECGLRVLTIGEGVGGVKR